jgi:Peptidase M15
MIRKYIVLPIVIILLVGLAGRALLSWYGFNVTSWWRSPWHNQEVGGQTFSLHQIGWAFDVTPVNSTLRELLRYWPFKYVVEDDHIHLQIL